MFCFAWPFCFIPGIYNCSLDKHISSIDCVVTQSPKSQNNGLMGPFSFNLTFFGDWWQHNQSKHKFTKIDKLIPIENHLHLLGCLPSSNDDLASPLKPWFPPLFPPTLLLLPHDLIHLGIFPPLGYASSPWEKYLALIHISPPLESNHLKGVAPTNVLQNNIA